MLEATQCYMPRPFFTLAFIISVYLIGSLTRFLRQITTHNVCIEKMSYHRSFISFRTANINEVIEVEMGQHFHNVISDCIPVQQIFFTMSHTETIYRLMGKINSMAVSLPKTIVEPFPGFLCVLVHETGLHNMRFLHDLVAVRGKVAMKEISKYNGQV